MLAEGDDEATFDLLCSVRQPRLGLGHFAARLLLDKAENPATSTSRLVFDPEHSRRASNRFC